MDAKMEDAPDDPQWVREETTLMELLIQLVEGKLKYLVAKDVGGTATGLAEPVLPGGMLLLPGSFNPVHEGHEEMGKQAAKMLGRPCNHVLLELCVTNADKGVIDVESMHRRIEKAVHRGNQVLASGAMLFQQKAEMFPGSSFVVGFDTYRHILDAKYYAPAGCMDGSSPVQQREWTLNALRQLHRCRVQFVVAGRIDSGDFKTIVTHPIMDLPQDLAGMFRELPDFRNDMSSTALRQKSLDTAPVL